MFKPDPKRTFRKDVAFKIPGPSGGLQQVTVPVDFRSIPRSELRDLQENADDDAVYERVVAGVHEIGGDDGQAISPEDGKRAMAEEYSFVFAALETYFDMQMGGKLHGKPSRRQRAIG